MLFSQESSPPFFAAPCRDVVTIDALQVLMTQTVVQVKALASVPSQDRTYSDLLQSLYTAFGKGLAVVGGLINAAAPINRIPPELMATIFAGTLSPSSIRHWYWSRHSYWPFEKPYVEDLHRIPKVCRHWRELALATPTLWSNIVTLVHPDGSGSEYYFGRSIYLPDDLSVGLNVHLTAPGSTPSTGSLENMAEFIVKNGPRIHELHIWDVSATDMPLVLQSFDASSLEHCTINLVGEGEGPLETGRQSLFSNGGGSRLRSLCLDSTRVLPKNEFPLLTLLKIVVPAGPDVGVCQAVDSFIKSLSGSPNLEEVYIDYVGTIDPTPSPSSKRPAPFTKTSLPHLWHFSFTCYVHHSAYNGDTLNPHPIDLFLEKVSVPPTCHMYLAVRPGSVFGITTDVPGNSAVDVLASVCRHVLGKDAVSHVFLELPGVVPMEYCPMQLVFPQGSLRLDVPVLRGVTSTFPHHDLFRAFPRLFSTATELRIHYSSDPALAALDSPLVFSAFPNISTLSVIRWNPYMLGGHGGDPHPPCGTSPSRHPSGVESEPGEHHDLPRYPLLGTLWTTVESGDEIDELETTLAARAALGLPIRRLIVTLHCSPRVEEQPEGSCDVDVDVARLRALQDVEKVVVMEGEVSSDLREVDWLTRLPDKYDLPSSVHRDWPTVWGLYRSTGW